MRRSVIKIGTVVFFLLIAALVVIGPMIRFHALYVLSASLICVSVNHLTRNAEIG